MRKRGERVLGPYEQHNGWRVIEIDAAGKRSSVIFETEDRAQRYIEIARAELAREDHTTETALAEYERHLTACGWKARSVETNVLAIRAFFPDAIPLSLLSGKRCAHLYETLRTTPTKRTGKPPSADYHRNALARAKAFLVWCVERRWIKSNPLAEVKGIGKRRPRGLSLGKEGNEFRIKQARAWYTAAMGLAADGDRGAIAALTALLLGMRATEIVTRKVIDLDEDEEAGDLLWIPCSKTPAGRRTLEVPTVLRPYLVALADGKGADRYLFERRAGVPRQRNWVRDNVRRICDLAEVPRVTAHAMRSTLATLTAERGLAGHLIAATLGHESFEDVTARAYAAPGAAAAGANRRGLVVLEGGAGRK